MSFLVFVGAIAWSFAVNGEEVYYEISNHTWSVKLCIFSTDSFTMLNDLKSMTKPFVKITNDSKHET